MALCRAEKMRAYPSRLRPPPPPLSECQAMEAMGPTKKSAQTGQKEPGGTAGLENGAPGSRAAAGASGRPAAKGRRARLGAAASQ